MKKKLAAFVLSSSMVLSLAVPAFAAATNTDPTKAPGEYLKEIGVIKGDQNGDLLEDSNWKRQDIAVLLSTLLQQKEEAKATANTHGFTDVRGTAYNGFISWAKEKGYLVGQSATSFGFDAEISYHEFAAIVLRALDFKVAYADVPAAAVEAKILPQGTDFTAKATRGDSYTVIVGALNTVIPGTGQTLGNKLGLPGFEAAAAAAVASGAKKITVNFGKAVDDTKATFVVKKGTVTLNVASKTFNADKTSAVLELSSKLSEGDYTVTVGGVEATDLTSTFKAENEKVTKIEFKASNAPLTALDDEVVNDLAIPYQVLNQYGENVTKTTTLTTNMGVVNGAAGTVDITGNYKINDVVAVTLVHAETATSAVATFTVAAQARVGEVAISGIYNKDNKTVNEDTNLTTDVFYLLVDAKDQYGNAITSAARLDSDLIINETNNTVVDAASRFTTVEINGENKTALQLNNPVSGNVTVGQSNITLISNTTGKNASFNVVVTENTRAETINLINPGSVYVGEDAYVPVEVFDKNGAAITSLSTLNNGTKGVRITVNGTGITNPFVLKDNVIQIKVPAAQITTTGLKPVIAMTASNKVTTLNLDAKAAAVPTVIRGLDADFAKAYKVSQTGVALNYTNLAIEDQYGRVMSDASVAAWLNADPTNRKIVVADSILNTATGNVVNLGTTTDIKGNGTTVTGITFDTTAVNGTEKLTFTLYNGTALNASVGESNISVTDGTQYSSYSVDTIGTVYDEVGAGKANAAAYDKEIKVYGVLANGAKVKLTHGVDYAVRALSNGTIDSDVNGDSVLNVSAALSYGTDKTEVVVPVSVTINKTGEQLTQDVTISKVAPKVASVKFVAGGAGVDGDAKTELTASSGTLAISDLVDGDIYNVVVTDQYGAKVVATTTSGAVQFADGTSVTAPTFTVVPTNNNVTVTGNGTYGATVSGIDAYEEFKVTVTYAGGATTTLTVKR